MRAGIHKCSRNVQKCIDGKKDKKAEWLLSRNLELKSFVSSPFHIPYLLGVVISPKEEKLIIYFHFQRSHFSLHLTFRFLAGYYHFSIEKVNHLGGRGTDVLN